MVAFRLAGEVRHPRCDNRRYLIIDRISQQNSVFYYWTLLRKPCFRICRKVWSCQKTQFRILRTYSLVLALEKCFFPKNGN